MLHQKIGKLKMLTKNAKKTNKSAVKFWHSNQIVTWKKENEKKKTKKIKIYLRVLKKTLKKTRKCKNTKLWDFVCAVYIGIMSAFSNSKQKKKKSEKLTKKIKILRKN